MLGFDDLNIGALGPDFELLDGGGAEGVGCAEEDAACWSVFSGGEVGGELAGGGGLAGAVDADHHDDLGRGGRMPDGAGDAVEDMLEFGFEELLEFVAALDAGAEGALAKVFHDEGGGGGAEVGGEEERLEVDEGGLVDLAGEGDDGADGFGEGLAGAGDRLLHAVEEAAFWLLRFGSCGLVRFCGAFAEDGEGHAVSSLAIERQGDWVYASCVVAAGAYLDVGAGFDGAGE